MDKRENQIYINWLKSDRFSLEDKKIMAKLSSEYVAQNFTNEKMKFGTAGIRAKLGFGTQRMNQFTYQQMSSGYAQHIINRHGEGAKVLISHDNRYQADQNALVCADVLTSYGIEVILIKDNELKATPYISYLINSLGLQGGIIVTASHNPKNYSGFKVYNETGGQILTEEEISISALMLESDDILNHHFQGNDSLISYLDENNLLNYFEDAKQALINTNVEKEKRFPVIFTAHHGTGSYDLPRFLKSLNYTNIIPVVEQCFPDPGFINSPSSNPEDEASFELSLEYANRHAANIILGVDPDADRLAVVVRHNESWKFLTGNEMGTIFAHYVLSNKKFTNPFIVSTFVSTNLIDRIGRAFGCNVYRTPTGFKWLGNEISKQINENNGELVVAFEEAIGSLNSPINRDKDSFQAAALALEIFDHYYNKDMTLVGVLEKEIFEQYGFWAGETVSYLISGDNWQSEIKRIFDKLKNTHISSVLDMQITNVNWNEIAGTLEWFFGDDNWVKFRMSGTEPKFKIYYNLYGTSTEDSKKLLKDFKKELDSIIKNI